MQDPTALQWSNILCTEVKKHQKKVTVTVLNDTECNDLSSSHFTDTEIIHPTITYIFKLFYVLFYPI